MKATLAIPNCCRPATDETTIPTKDGQGKPRLRAVRSSPIKYRSSPRPRPTRYPTPVKFLVPKQRPRAKSNLGEKGRSAISSPVIINEDQEGRRKPVQSQGSINYEVKRRNSIESEKADFNKLCAEDTGSYELDDEEKNTGVSAQRRHLRTEYLSSTAGMFGVKRKGSLIVRSRSLRKGQRRRAKSALVRPSMSSLVSSRSSSNTPVLGSIQKEFHIGAETFTTASFLESKIYL